MKNLMNMVCMPLVLIGALEWGLKDMFGFTIVGELFGTSAAERVIHVLFAVSALGMAFGWFGRKRK